jgi:phage protein D
MATAIDIYAGNRTFYVPQFSVSIAGQPLEQGILRDVMQVTYHDNVDEIDGFELVVNNWDAQKFLPKYEPPSNPAYAGIFDPGKRIDLRMGYVGDQILMLTGEITTLEPNFPESGGPTLSVRGLNVLHALRTEQHTFSWENTRDSDIAVDLGNRPLKQGQAGLGMKVRIDPAKDETAETFVMMNNQYDIVFLLERARRHGYQLVLNPPDDSNPRPWLYFGPSRTKLEASFYRLEWGKSLNSFKPKLSSAQQIGTVTVRGWDRKNNKAIEESAKWTDLVPAGPEQQRLQQISQAFGNRTEIITDQPVRTSAEAKQKASDILRRQLLEMVTASGSTVGLADLRAGTKVQIAGPLGPRYTGTYYITQSTHTIGENGYRTNFEARRDASDQSAAPTQSGGPAQ